MAVTRKTRPEPVQVSEQRVEEMQREVKEARALDKVLHKYDTNKSGRLETEQVRKLLTDMDYTTAANTPPSEEELEFIMVYAMKRADRPDEGLDKHEVKAAIIEWKLYLKKKVELDAWLEKYDKSQTGKLERPEVKEFLQSLNGGLEVTDEEVDWVMSKGDVVKDDALTKPELLRAVMAWYVIVEKKKSCCVVL